MRVGPDNENKVHLVYFTGVPPQNVHIDSYFVVDLDLFDAVAYQVDITGLQWALYMILLKFKVSLHQNIEAVQVQGIAGQQHRIFSGILNLQQL